MKRAGLKDKVSFIANRFDSQNSISVTDVTSILNMNNDEKSNLMILKYQMIINLLENTGISVN